MALPLRLRLPNPPPTFVGRKAESAELAASIRRSPVTVVWGLGGAGKTALLLRTLHAKLSKAIPRVLFVAIRPGVSDPAVEVARALGEATAASIDWQELAASPEMLAALILDLAEAGPRTRGSKKKKAEPWILVLDDLHHAEPERVSAFLATAARYARRTRIIATSRFDPALPRGAGVAIALGAMAETDLVELARRVRKLSLDDARAEAKRAAGSPWRVLQGAGGGDAIPDALATSLAALAEVEIPISREIFTRIASTQEAPEVLQRRGLIEISGGGVRLHDVVRGMLPPLDAASRARAGLALAGSGDPATALEGVRLLLASERFDEAARALGVGTSRPQRPLIDALLSASYGPRLWSLLAPHDVPSLAAARLRCAVDLGTPDALSRVREPAPSAPLADHLEWARSRRSTGDISGAFEAAGRVRAQAEKAGDRRIAFEAGLLRGRCRIVQGSLAELLEEAASLVAPTKDDAARLETVVAQTLSYLGRMPEALARIDAVARGIDELSPAAALEVGVAVARTLYEGSRLADADAMLDQVLRRLGPAALLRLHGRLAMLTKAYIAQDRGHITEARALMKRLEPLAKGSGILRGSLKSLELTIALAFGDIESLDDLLAAWMEEAARGTNRSYFYMAAALRVRFASLVGLPAPRDALGRGEIPDPTIRGMLDVWEIQNRLRQGTTPPRSAFPPPSALAGNRELAVLARTIAAEWSLVSGDPQGALADARTAVEWAIDAGLALTEADARPFLCDVLYLSGRADDHAAATRAAEALADRLPSARLAAEAAFHRALIRAEPAVLEPLAAASDPLSRLPGSRRARAILSGQNDSLDAIDRRMVDAVRARNGWSIESVPVHAPGAPWGLDETRTAVWLSDGRVVPLKTRLLLFRLLLAIADHGGAASKEDLVRGVWGESEYHRLRHDNRLHLAVLKARRAIEDDPAVPLRLLATPDGYALGGVVRRLRTGA